MAVNRIQRLPSIVIDRIAAGEVIESPASVIKELLENSLDAGAKNIKVSTKSAGLESIVLQDDGAGISFDDLPASIERHATSKIHELDDIESILSYGFRGEALASIASVSLLTVESKTRDSDLGGIIESRGGSIVRHESQVCADGTVIRVQDLFYATPARRKFIKSERTENLKILTEFRKIALANPSVQIEYIRDGETALFCATANSLSERITQLFPTEQSDRWIQIRSEDENIELSGFISSPDAYRSSRQWQYMFVNNRCVEMKHLSFLVRKAYGDLIPGGTHPACVLFINVDPQRIDVNVHPAKKEIRFLDEHRIQSLVIRGIQKTLSASPVSFSNRTLSRNFLVPGAAGIREQEQNSPSFSFDSPSDSASHSTAADPILRHDRFFAEDVQEDQETEIVKSMPSSLRQYGVVFGTYILATAEDGLYLIDQHTAHERVNFEKKKASIESLSHQRQPLLTPVVLKLNREEMEVMLSHADLLLRNGFLMEELGPESAAIREVPLYVESGSEADLFRHMIDRILDGETELRIFEEYSAMRACKASIKRNDIVAPEVLADILTDLMKCEDPTRCPHGRPTMVKITRSALDRMFMRST